MTCFCDALTEWAGRLAAWLFFLIGVIIVYEVVARYVFLSPTIWSEELSRCFQIWATYLAAAYVLKHRHLIAIEIVSRSANRLLRICCESLSLLAIAGFSLIAVIWGMGIVVDSIRVGRASSSMLAVPSWLTEIAIPVGFFLLFIQALTQLFRIFSNPENPADTSL